MNSKTKLLANFLVPQRVRYFFGCIQYCCYFILILRRTRCLNTKLVDRILYNGKIVLPRNPFIFPSSFYTKRQHTLMIISPHISTQSGSHIFKFNTSELFLALSNMNIMHFESSQISYYFQLLRIPNSHNRKVRIIGQTEMQLPKYTGKTTFAVITKVWQGDEPNKNVNKEG